MNMMASARTWLSRKRAMAGALVGARTGFFVQYGFMGSVQPQLVYPDVAVLCEQADIAAVLAALSQNSVNFSVDPFWQQSTSHLGPLDAVIDYAMVRAIRPQRIIEIGSGRSTQVLTRAVQDNGAGQIICIDPAPRLDISDLPVTLHRRMLEPADRNLVEQLVENDILFIDSSHIMQPGTDVDIELNILLPALKPGVFVHVHDVFLPWGYPAEWAPRNWNEVCGLIPWICSGAFEIVFPSHFVLRERTSHLQSALGSFYTAIDNPAAGSFWMRRRG